MLKISVIGILLVYSASISNQYIKPNLDEYICMLAVLYHEARNQPIKGVQAVASVVVNRTKSEKYPDTVCAVVKQPKQFTNVEYTLRKAIEQPTMLQKDLGYTKVARVAYEALYADFKPSVKALYYHTTKTKPVWSKNLVNRKVIGSHVFGVL